METMRHPESLKALAAKALRGNRAGNSKDTQQGLAGNFCPTKDTRQFPHWSESLKALAARALGKDHVLDTDKHRELLDQTAFDASREGPIMTRNHLEAVLAPTDYQDAQLMTQQGLRSLAHAVQTIRIMERGEVPSGWTEQTACKRCGPVPTFPGCPPKVIGCPWCFVKKSQRL